MEETPKRKKYTLSDAAIAARRMGGSVVTDRKAAATRLSGQLGGRPRTIKLPETNPGAFPRGPADAKLLWPFILGSIFSNGLSGELLFSGSDCVLYLSGRDPIWFFRMKDASVRYMQKVFVGKAMRCKLVKDTDGLRQHYEAAVSLTQSGAKIDIKHIKQSPTPPPTKKEQARIDIFNKQIEEEKLQKLSRTVLMLRKMKAKDHEIAASLNIPLNHPAFQC